MKNVNLLFFCSLLLLTLAACKKDDDGDVNRYHDNKQYGLLPDECIAIKSFRGDATDWELMYYEETNTYITQENSITRTYTLNNNNQVINYLGERQNSSIAITYSYFDNGLLSNQAFSETDSADVVTNYNHSYVYDTLQTCKLVARCINGECENVNYLDDNCSYTIGSGATLETFYYDAYNTPIGKLLPNMGLGKRNLIKYEEQHATLGLLVTEVSGVTYNENGYPTEFTKLLPIGDGLSGFSFTRRYEYFCFE